jgi:hypothetical protein
MMIPTVAPASIAVPMLQHHGSIDGACRLQKNALGEKVKSGSKFDSTPSKKFGEKGKKHGQDRHQARPGGDDGW